MKKIIANYDELIERFKALSTPEAIVFVEGDVSSNYYRNPILLITRQLYKKIKDDYNGVGSLFIRKEDELYALKPIDASVTSTIFKFLKIKNYIIL